MPRPFRRPTLGSGAGFILTKITWKMIPELPSLQVLSLYRRAVHSVAYYEVNGVMNHKEYHEEEIIFVAKSRVTDEGLKKCHTSLSLPTH